ncbi:rifin [Plasmodium reichenowi]|uniref:Rifin n=1 Tax=Plasmodium reichenowi TaxID=5854 RepID=A0A060RMB2_PLARE|nr:rifin [Plasmodium reichenowi]
MKVQYINILLFALPLNILVNTHKKPSITPHYTPKIPTNRSLCECELYAPANYDNDPQMKDVMQQFEDRTSQRFHEYDDRMKTTRQKCKDRCDKEIKKIILKDKLEKELMDKFATLQTDIQSDAIPTCICEKSMVDKMEKNCMKCTQNLGGIVAPSSGVLAGIAEGALYAWKPGALDAAIKTAIAKGSADIAAAGIEASEAAGLAKVVAELEALSVEKLIPGILKSIFSKTSYTNSVEIAKIITVKKTHACGLSSTGGNEAICETFDIQVGAYVGGVNPNGPPVAEAIRTKVNAIVTQAKGVAAEAAEVAKKGVAAEITEKETAAINTIFMSKQTAIIASVVTIVVIILVMVIIYLILRYRRKKKMKKKLQYIKLLEE